LNGDILIIILVVIVPLSIFIFIGFRTTIDGHSPQKEFVDGATKIKIHARNYRQPGSVIFHSDGRVTHAPEKPEAHQAYIVAKLTRKIAREPDDALWYAERAKALMALGRYAQAIPDLNKVIETHSQSPESYFPRGICYYRLEDHARAVEDLRRYKALFEEREKKYPPEETAALTPRISLQYDEEAIKILEKLEQGV
jgi:tetratricopeptide (TPR) repeat protein